MNKLTSIILINQHLPFAVLRVLTPIRYLWARNYTTPVEVLEELTRHGDWRTRWYVGMNPSTPVWLLERLSGDVNADARCAVASNTRTPVHVLEKLSHDSDWSVREKAEEALERLGT